jgi:hypothetical protein
MDFYVKNPPSTGYTYFMKTLFSLLLMATMVSASSDLDFPVEAMRGIFGTIDLTLVSEGKGYSYDDKHEGVYQDGKDLSLNVHSAWDTRQGFKAEMHSSSWLINFVYLGNLAGVIGQRIYVGTPRDKVVHKEDLAKLLKICVGNETFDAYLLHDYSRYGTYQLGDGPVKDFTVSRDILGIKTWKDTRVGAVGVYLEGQRSRSLHLLRISSAKKDSTLAVEKTIGPLNEMVNGFMAGFFRSPDPTGLAYLTYSASGGIGYSESPLNKLNSDIGLPGYYLYNGGYDLNCDLKGSVITGLNLKFGYVRVRVSGEFFTNIQVSAPSSQVYPVGVSPSKVPKGKTISQYDNAFDESYSLAEMVYGASAQLKVLF